jgi:hypothetical protein
MSHDSELRARRDELARAVNAHDLEAVRAFLHPSFVARARTGHATGYDDMLRLAGQLLSSDGFRETVQVEAVAVCGDAARLAVTREQATTGWLGLGRRGTARAVETWWKVEGRWLLVEEQEV